MHFLLHATHGSWNESVNETEPCVLIIDDDESVREALLFLMESVSLNAKAYVSATQFMAGYETDVPGCLISDIRMPGMSGLELQQALKKRNSQMPTTSISIFSPASRLRRKTLIGGLSGCCAVAASRSELLDSQLNNQRAIRNKPRKAQGGRWAVAFMGSADSAIACQVRAGCALAEFVPSTLVESARVPAHLR